MMTNPPICDYEGSDYRKSFWENQGREYEDLVERVALRRLMPPTGSTLIEVGAGFGRMAAEYTGYDKVVLFDYSRSLLRDGQSRIGSDPRFIFVAGNFYEMPFVDGLFETMVQIRSLHHSAEPDRLFSQLSRIARPEGNYILEFANKHNLKAILRYLLRRQTWSPFDHEPVEFRALHYDFHPSWVREHLQQVGFEPGRMLSVSYFRVGALKRYVPTSWLVSMDSALQPTGNWKQLSPSVFMHNRNPSARKAAEANQFFACPKCATPLDDHGQSPLVCGGCGLKWKVENGLYDFKKPMTD